jgi:hypothetical protein
VVTFNTARSVGPGFLVAQTWCYWVRSTSCGYDGFRYNDGGPLAMTVLVLSSDKDSNALDWLRVCLSLL